MNSPTSTFLSALIHVALLALLALVPMRRLPLPERPPGMELEIIDTEHAMPLPDPSVAEVMPEPSDPEAPASAPEPMPVPPSQAPQASVPAPLPMTAPPRPVEVRALGPGPLAVPDKPQPQAVVRAAAPVTAPPAVAVPAALVPAAPPRPRLDTGALAHSLAARNPQGRQTRLNSATLGSAIGKATPRGAAGLTVRQRANLEGMIRSQITPCWNPPAIDENAAGATVTMRIALDRGGNVVGAPSVTAIRGQTAANAAWSRSLAGSVRRAVLRCAPLRLPAELFDAWADVELNFDPRDIS